MASSISFPSSRKRSRRTEILSCRQCRGSAEVTAFQLSRALMMNEADVDDGVQILRHLLR